MEKVFIILSGLKRGILTTLALATLANEVLAQRPTHIPPESPPVGFFDSISNIIVYVAIPVLILVFFLLWKNYTKKQNKKKEEILKKGSESNNE